VVRPGPEHGAREREALAQQRIQVDLGAGSAEQPDEHDAAAGPAHPEIDPDVGAADEIEHGVDLADALGEAVAGGDGAVEPQRDGPVELGRRARCPRHAGPRGPRQSERCEPDAAGDSVDQ
jgi:hypothetical protein